MTRLLLKFLPKTLISHADRIYRLRVVFNKIGQKFSTIDLFGQHHLTTGLEDGLALSGWHGDELLYALVEFLYSTRLEGTIVATDRTIGSQWSGMDTVTEFIFVFQFAEIADAANEVVEADEGNA